MNRMGDKCPPWGVPEGTGDKLDEYPRTEVKWDLWVKCENKAKVELYFYQQKSNKYIIMNYKNCLFFIKFM